MIRYDDTPLMPLELHTLAMELEQTRGYTFARQARAVHLLEGSGVDRWDVWAKLRALVDHDHWDDRRVQSPDLRLANALSRSRAVRGCTEPAGRTLLVSYDLRRPELVPFGDAWLHEVIGDRGLTFTRGTVPVVDEHDGPQIGTVVAAELRPMGLDMWVELGEGERQDELLARAYFHDKPLGTSIQFRDDLPMLRYSPGQMVRQGVEVQHLAFCDDPVRVSTVRRATLPTTHPRTRSARALLGPHVEPEPDVPALPAADPYGPGARSVPGGREGWTVRVVGRVLSIDGRSVR